MFRERKFRFNVWLLGSVLTVVLILITQLLPTFSNWRLAGESHLFTTVVMLAAIWLISGILWSLFPTYVGSAGIRATDGIGRFQDVPWEDIQKVSTIFGFYWIRHGKFGKALCFPMFLEDRKAFREFVLDRAPERNVFRAFLNP